MKKLIKAQQEMIQMCVREFVLELTEMKKRTFT